MERLCINCKHYVNDFGVLTCRALEGKQNPETGQSIRDTDLFPALMMRMTLCGWDDPKFWEPKGKT